MIMGSMDLGVKRASSIFTRQSSPRCRARDPVGFGIAVTINGERSS